MIRPSPPSPGPARRGRRLAAALLLVVPLAAWAPTPPSDTTRMPADGVAAALARLLDADAAGPAAAEDAAVDGGAAAIEALARQGDGGADDAATDGTAHDGGANATATDSLAPHAGSLRRFYEERGFQPAWLGADGLNASALALLEALRRGDEDGLAPADYRPTSLPPLPSVSPAEWLAELEVSLSRTLIDFAGDLHTGRLDPQAVDPELVLARSELNEARVLREVVAAPDLGRFLTDLAPRNPYYQGLRRALADYRGLAAAEGGGWPTVAAGPDLERGATGERVRTLRRRLEATGDLPPIGVVARDDLFDAAVEDAVRAFQRRHGLYADGVVGPRTLAALNVPAEERVRQIIVNMERWRWMPDDLGARYLLVNLAGFELKVIEGGRTVLAMPVVVGQPYRSTPVFSDVMTYVVTNPYWHVPQTIAVEDILPKARRDPYHLIEQGIRVFRGRGGDAVEFDPRAVDWWGLGGQRFPFRLRQEPGPQNPLGRLKFMFPNEYEVYLHDTPSRGLFSRAVRANSSGCIRLADPIALAEYLLRDHPRLGQGGVRAVIESGRTLDFRLPEPVPIHLTYSTAWVDEGGAVHFRDDIYGRDARLREALFPTVRVADRN